MVKFLDYYIEKFKKLKRNLSTDGFAPHKPVLLLSVIKAIEDEQVYQNVFPKKLLKPIFEKTWKLLVISGHSCSLDSPFVAMSSEGFWHIDRRKTSPGYMSVSLDAELYEYLQFENGRNVLIRTLLDSYFWNAKDQWGKLYPDLFTDNGLQEESSTTLNASRSINDTTTKKEQSKFSKIETLKLTQKCLQALKQENILNIKAFCEFDISKLLRMPGFGLGTIQNLYKLQIDTRREHNITTPIPILDLDSLKETQHDKIPGTASQAISSLPISRQCIDVLQGLGIRTIHDFCEFDLNRLIEIVGVGRKKIEGLYELQQQQRNIFSICTPLPKLDLQKKEPSKLKRSTPNERDVYEEEYSYPSINLSFVHIPMRECVELPDDSTIEDLKLPDHLKQHLKYLALYEFDELTCIASTEVEYFWRRLGNEKFNKLITFFKQNGLWKGKRFLIENNRFINEHWEWLLITKSFVGDTDYTNLHHMGIYTWKDYNEYITTPHKISSNFFYVCNFHINNASKIRHFLELLENMKDIPITDIFLSSQDEKSRAIYTYRIEKNKTLDVVAKKMKLTRERIRQITKKIDEIITQIHPIKYPLTSISSLYIYMESFFELKMGVIDIKTFMGNFQKNFHWSSQQIQILLHYCSLNFDISLDDKNIIIQSITCLSCNRLCNSLKSSMTNSESLSFIKQKKIAERCCSLCPLWKGRMPHWDVFLPIFCEKNTFRNVFYDSESKEILSKKEYILSRGSRKEVIEYILAPDKKMTFNEISKILIRIRPELSEKQIYAYIKSAEVVLADRGTYMLKSALPSIPNDLLLKIIDLIKEKISVRKNALCSLSLVMKKFRRKLVASGCTTYYMLFEILKKRRVAGVRFIKCPYVTSSKNTDRFSITHFLEEYVAENGRMHISKLKEYYIAQGGNEHVFIGAYSGSDKLIVDDDDFISHFEDLNITEESLLPIIAKLEQMDNSTTITNKKLFEDYKVLCIKMNIMGPKMLFNVLRLLVPERFIFRYPQISKNKDNIVSIQQQVINFIKSTNSYCTVDELNEFCTRNHFTNRVWYFKRPNYPEILRYMPGAWVHIDTLGYSAEWKDIVAKVARKVLAESTTPKQSYAVLQDICDKEDELPSLQNDLWWTPVLVAEILEESGKFLVYGKNKGIFSLKNSELKLNNFGDLCALLLNEDFDGAANLHEFSDYLRAQDLISGVDLHNSLLQGSSRIIINKHEVYVSKEVIPC